MKSRITLTAIFCLLALLIGTAATAPALTAEAAFWQQEETPAVPAATGGDISLSCKSAILIEPLTGGVIFESSADSRLPEASITKVMTVLLVFEALDSGRISLDDVVVCSAHAASMGGSQIWLEEGEQMTVKELLTATMVGSANDASVVLAEHVAGTHESFVALMNERARELGLKDTAYKNCTGLDADGHITSARDIAAVCTELMKHEEVFDYSTIWMDSLRNGETELTNTNKLIRTYDGATGLKTGTTSQAGCCVAATAQRDGMTLIAVVMGAPNSKNRFADARKLLDYGFANYSLLDLSTIAVEPPVVKVVKGMSGEIGTTVCMQGSVLIPKGRAGDVVVTVSAAENVCAPVELGQAVGAVTLALDGESIGSYDIVSSTKIDKITFGNVFYELLDGLLGL